LDAVAQVRRFNRAVPPRVGALDDEFLSRDRSLGLSRVLWEIGLGPTDVRALRSRLDLDSGYLSRLLRALERDGLIVVEASPADGRVRTARLTPAGQAECDELDRRSDAAARALLDPLSAGQRDRLVAAMAEVERLLAASAVQFAPRDPREPDARRCLRAYFDELGRRFEDGFDPELSIPADDDELVPPAGLLVVATLHGEPVGCGALKFDDDAAQMKTAQMKTAQMKTAQIKRMWVSSSVRGIGLGRRLLADLEARAAAAGARRLRLETNRTLEEAIAMYRSAGYREVAPFNDERYAHHWFEKAVTGRG
jgi:DNA-binding MarR family transcriptional regulator/GNAT superfamily N-acetyltransferase